MPCVLMSLLSTPADLIAASTLAIFSELAARASRAVAPFVWSPSENSASFGTE